MAQAAEFSRGDLWQLDFGPDIGRHPAVLIGRTGAMRRRRRVIVALITSQGIGLPTEVAVGPVHGLTRDSVIDCEDLYTFGADALRGFIGRLDETTLVQLDDRLHLALGLRD
jgi:mRNA-degrading endonuclease toxin of MazEF toxin-antitoxin module